MISNSTSASPGSHFHNSRPPSSRTHAVFAASTGARTVTGVTLHQSRQSGAKGCDDGRDQREEGISGTDCVACAFTGECYSLEY